MTILIRQATCFLLGKWQTVDVRIADGKIVKIGSDLDVYEAESVIEADGLTLLPGFVDPHVHLREPGFTDKETIATGSRAAARGGFTAIAAMPNTDPVTDSPDKIRRQQEIAQQAMVKVHFYAAITEGLAGERLTDAFALKDSGAFALTDDGVGIQTARQMLHAMERAHAAHLSVVAHCEDNSLAGDGVVHDGEVSARLHLPSIPGEAESAHIVRDALLAEKTGAHYHVCHVSSASSVQAIREAKQRGIRITAEVTPHHLVLTEDDIAHNDARFKMNPPLRSQRDRAALIAGLLDGTIDFIATDHAPHTTAEKGQGFLKSPFGIVGLETAFPLMYTRLVKTGLFTLTDLVASMSTKPAACFGLTGGRIAEGVPADLTMVDLRKEMEVDPTSFYSKGRNTPFTDWMLHGWPVWTMVDGRVVYDEAQGGMIT